MNKPTLIGFAGSIMALVFMIYALLTLGWIPVALFVFFGLLAFQDLTTGRINLVSFLPPGILLIIFYWFDFLLIYVPVFGLLAGIWILLLAIKKTTKIDPEKLRYGFGDVLGLPYALTLSWILIPFWGLVVFAGSQLGLMPWFLRKKQRRFLPWFLPGLIINFVLAVVL